MLVILSIRVTGIRKYFKSLNPESDASTIVRLANGVRANHLVRTLFDAQGARSHDNTRLFSSDSKEVGVAESGILDASTMESAESRRTGGCGETQLRRSKRGVK